MASPGEHDGVVTFALDAIDQLPNEHALADARRPGDMDDLRDPALYPGKRFLSDSEFTVASGQLDPGRRSGRCGGCGRRLPRSFAVQAFPSRGASEAEPWISIEQPDANLFEIPRIVGGELRRARRIAHLFALDHVQGGPLERRSACENLEEHDADGVPVRGFGQSSWSGLFWRHVRSGCRRGSRCLVFQRRSSREPVRNRRPRLGLRWSPAHSRVSRRDARKPPACRAEIPSIS